MILSNLRCCYPTGGIPGPIAFGSVIDISCLLWQDQCGEQGSCYLYHNSAMSQYTLVAGIIYKVTSYTHSKMPFTVALDSTFRIKFLGFEKLRLWVEVSLLESYLIFSLIIFFGPSSLLQLQHPLPFLFDSYTKRRIEITYFKCLAGRWHCNRRRPPFLLLQSPC